MTRISVTVDGASYTDDVEPRTLLVHYLREQLGQDRHGGRLRHQQLRRLHGAPRRPQREVVQRPRRPGRRARGDHDRGARRRRRAAPDAEGLPRVPRPPVRLLHAGDDHAGRRPAQRQPAAQRGGDPARASRATSAGAPATTTSSGRCRRPPASRSPTSRRSRGARMTATEQPEIGARPAPQGGPAPHHRPHPVDRQHPARRACCTSRWCAARSRTPRSPRSTPRRPRPPPTSSPSSPAPTSPTSQGTMITAWPLTDGPEDARPPADRRRPGRLRRRGRRRRRRPHGGRGTRRRRAGRRRLRGAARRPRPQGGREGRGPGPPRPRHQQVRVLAARLGRPGLAAAAVDEAIAEARANGIVIEREYRQPAADPRVHGAPLGGRATRPASRSRCGPRPRSRTSCGSRSPRPPACPSRRSASSRPTSAAASAASSQIIPEEWIAFCAARTARHAGEVDRDPLASRWSPGTTAATSGSG